MNTEGGQMAVKALEVQNDAWGNSEDTNFLQPTEDGCMKLFT